MGKRRWVVRLKAAAEARGQTAYAISQALGLNQGTVRKWIGVDKVVAQFLPDHVVEIADYLGVDWNPNDPHSPIQFTDEATELHRSTLAVAAFN